ncbi:hypothetical protein CI109_100100 [Kwoniella shandongensis]|uniref:Uncharacterized protein n=1 Tax=Kwoniella shandongensis TaxID=1734106 RepID=A0A5M6BNG9_9TREE|nr:uncharacterized protein CI109_007243 [Kwoniella shandongensis]KAA5524408.1 hypothetical protein CI109_007243 [Kwoniella shandongensis]
MSSTLSSPSLKTTVCGKSCPKRPLTDAGLLNLGFHYDPVTINEALAIAHSHGGARMDRQRIKLEKDAKNGKIWYRHAEICSGHPTPKRPIVCERHRRVYYAQVCTKHAGNGTPCSPYRDGVSLTSLQDGEVTGPLGKRKRNDSIEMVTPPTLENRLVKMITTGRHREKTVIPISSSRQMIDFLSNGGDVISLIMGLAKCVDESAGMASGMVGSGSETMWTEGEALTSWNWDGGMGGVGDVAEASDAAGMGEASGTFEATGSDGLVVGTAEAGWTVGDGGSVRVGGMGEAAGFGTTSQISSEDIGEAGMGDILRYLEGFGDLP